MRYDAVEFLSLQPIAAPGQYKAKLSVDGVEQVSQFELSINPNETYSKAQLREKKEFWMDLYNTAKTSSKQLKTALATQEQVMAKAEAKTALMPQAEAVSAVVEEYKATYIPKGRTLAEIINQPAKIFSKMVWLHNMMESSEGPATQSMIDQFADLKAQMSAADAAFEKDMKAAMAAFDSAS